MPTGPNSNLTAVALHAGVSKATASKALNGRGDVAQDTRERVLAAAAAVGYTPPVRRPPDQGPHLWVALTDLANPYFAALLDGLLREAHGHGATATTFTWSADRPGPGPAPDTARWIRRGTESGAQAFILVTTPVTVAQERAAREAAAPLMAIDPLSSVPDGVLSVSSTNWRGGVQATEHLVALGHRRIAFVGAPRASNPGSERLAGYRTALEAAGIGFDPALVIPGAYVFDDGLRTESLLTGDDAPTAVFAANDLVACGVLEAARRAGLDVPSQLSVVGFDDTIVASVSAPPLTTVRQPLAEMGALAARTCLGALDGTPPVTPHLQLATTLVVRGSTGRPAARP